MFLLFNRSSNLLEPLLCALADVWSDSFIGSFIKGIQPVDFLLSHHFQLQRRSIDWNYGEGIETLELTVFGLVCLDHNSCIFCADTVAALGINSWLNG